MKNDVFCYCNTLVRKLTDFLFVEVHRLQQSQLELLKVEKLQVRLNPSRFLDNLEFIFNIHNDLNIDNIRA